MTLESLGWNPVFAEAFKAYEGRDLIPGRIALQHRTYYSILSEIGELRGEVTGKMEYLASGPQDLPAVGDWVVLHPRPEESTATIVDLLPRRTKFSRKVAGRKTEEQIVAANVDVVFIVSGLDHDFNLRRIERYLVLSRQSGANPVILLNKADLRDDHKEIRKAIALIAGDIPVILASALKDKGLDAIAHHLKPGCTGALLGSSGVGKTTIINHLLGSTRKTAEVRENDSRGRHTTSARELILLPSGGLLIDTPGMRELQLWGEAEGVDETFEDIEELERQCKFRDCSHDVEPGCEIRAALEKGILEPERYESYKKLLRELAYHNRKYNEVEQRKEKERIKKRTSQFKRNFPKGKRS
ncbi:MAG: ribosome small subunit-dependent GTPase A [Bacteroidota bacterium]